MGKHSSSSAKPERTVIRRQSQPDHAGFFAGLFVFCVQGRDKSQPNSGQHSNNCNRAKCFVDHCLCCESAYLFLLHLNVPCIGSPWFIERMGILIGERVDDSLKLLQGLFVLCEVAIQQVGGLPWILLEVV
jgi:hypothetical protein